ncbi:neocarzinostatin apoprotein domain-containing protein [Micromonospora sp. NPDC003197]
MRTFRHRALTLAVLLATSCGLAVVAVPSAAFAAPTLTVSATSGLTDKQQVTVNGSGFTPNLKQIAVGQCVAGFKGPTDCNLAGGAAFVNADGSGKLPMVTLRLAQKFGAFDCTKQECVVAAQILPAGDNADQVQANKVSVPLTFGKAPAQTTPPPATPTAAPSSTPTATIPASTMPAVAAGTPTPSLVNANPVSAGPDRYAVAVLVGFGLLLLCIGLLVLMPYRNRRSS